MKATVNLFCFPFAGGNRYSYHGYLQDTPSSLKIIPMEYPGRGSRSVEPLISNIDLLVDDLYHRINKNIDQSDYAIYGHSMGALVGYLLVRKLLANNHRPPLHIFASGAPAPSSHPRSMVTRHLLPDAEFVRELKKLDGTAEELLLNKDMFEYISPILRSDFKACEKFEYVHLPPLNIPFTVFTGTEEEIDMEHVYLWQKESAYEVDFIQLPGKHFFIFQHTGTVMSIISEKLCVNVNAYQQ